MTQTYELVNQSTGQSITGNARMYGEPGARTLGLMGRLNLPDDAAYIFQYADIGRRGVHMMFVFHTLDVVWLQNREVHHKATLRPFIGHDTAQADAFIEFPAGRADGIRVGDKLAWAPR